MRHSLLLLAALTLAIYPAQAAVVIADTNMHAVDYTGLATFNAFNVSSLFGFSAAAGGNPGNHRVITATLGTPGFGYAYEWNAAVTYDPSVSGPINHFGWSLDGRSNTTTNIGFLVRQNGNTYFHIGHFPLTASYLTDSIPVTNVRQQSGPYSNRRSGSVRLLCLFE